MRIGDVLYFSARFPFAELNFEDHVTLIEALQDRVDGYYLQPAFRCLASGDALRGRLGYVAPQSTSLHSYMRRSPERLVEHAHSGVQQERRNC